jgi:hypothetical protein
MTDWRGLMSLLNTIDSMSRDTEAECIYYREGLSPILVLFFPREREVRLVTAIGRELYICAELMNARIPEYVSSVHLVRSWFGSVLPRNPEIDPTEQIAAALDGNAAFCDLRKAAVRALQIW